MASICCSPPDSVPPCWFGAPPAAAAAEDALDPFGDDTCSLTDSRRAAGSPAQSAWGKSAGPPARGRGRSRRRPTDAALVMSLPSKRDPARLGLSRAGRPWPTSWSCPRRCCRTWRRSRPPDGEGSPRSACTCRRTPPRRRTRAGHPGQLLVLAEVGLDDRRVRLASARGVPSAISLPKFSTTIRRGPSMTSAHVVLDEHDRGAEVAGCGGTGRAARRFSRGSGPPRARPAAAGRRPRASARAISTRRCSP